MKPSHRVSVAAATTLVAALLTVATAVAHFGLTPSDGFRPLVLSDRRF